MIRGIGIDVCDISRMRKAVSREGFCKRVFSEEEITYAESNADPAAHYAAAFAAREALSKATGWGIAGLGINSCSIERTASGPRFKFDENTFSKFSNEGIDNVFLSISHEAGIAVAVVILEKNQ
ncbi:Holo-[acyl-carrier-protein] synthase [bioreactor metagenome]|jgi:holo-[acyl-carrier protein] synthase|uniref:Holo-[acyl-carrier-protein] synthase n=1 Tax=bioreactor metagenome TaxID=1076179 RepID=A0A645BH02_9ZZZZ|nr:holo-ACP synthase [Synergistaceae bacterium]MDD2350588.1 holo-ACP synthase [Synergistaceae bacterium]MDD3672533.1 holo-ACP synthase [Synergistaceae bacterium]MDD3963787.1 holo-ACP synthase [Synergistaceae bacterium]MDD4704688.1 holo-ACP synthase [Synergistaceae bacterium]